MGRRVRDRPAALARVGGVARDRLQPVAVGLERERSQFAQPRANDRSLSPEVRDLGLVEVVLALVEDVEPLGVGLHEAVLDAVVNHLHVVACAGPSELQPAPGSDRGPALLVGRRGEHVQYRRKAPDGFGRPADHHAVADLQPPHAS